MSYFFRYNKLIEDGGKGKETADKEVSNVNFPMPHDSQQQHATTDSQTLTVSTLTTNLDEFKILFLTQEKLCYELRAENAILTNKLEMTMSTSKKQLLQIKRLKLKMCKLETANETFEKILGYSNYSNINPLLIQNCPPPPPLPLNTISFQKSRKLSSESHMPMNTVLDEFKKKFQPKD